MGKVIKFPTSNQTVHIVTIQVANGKWTGYVVEWLKYGECYVSGDTKNDLIDNAYDEIPKFCTEHNLRLPDKLLVSISTDIIENPPYTI